MVADGNKTLYLLDGLNFAFRAFHVQPDLTTSRGEPVGALSLFMGMLLRVVGRFWPKHIGVIFDDAGGSFRNKLYPLYKANRPPRPEAFRVQAPFLREVCAALGLRSLTVPGYEADDAMATLARLAVWDGLDVVLLSTDKDLTQCLTERVSMWDIGKRQMFGPELAMAKFGVPPALVPDVQALCGDKADNIPGAPGVGVKTAAALIEQFGDLEGVLSNIHRVSGPKRRASLEKHQGQVRLYRRLTELRTDVPLEFRAEQWSWRGVDRELLEVFTERFELSRLRDQAMGLPVREVRGRATATAVVRDLPASEAATLFDALDRAPVGARVELALDAVERGVATIAWDRPGSGLGRTTLTFGDGSKLVLRATQARNGERSLVIAWDVLQAYQRGDLLRRAHNGGRK